LSPPGIFFGGDVGPGISSPAFGIVWTPCGIICPPYELPDPYEPYEPYEPAEPHELHEPQVSQLSQLSQPECFLPNLPRIRLNRPLVSPQEQDEQEEQDEEWPYEPQLPQVLEQVGVVLQLSQHCLWKWLRSRSRHDGLSQQLSQEEQDVVQVEQEGWQQVVGQQL